uniref:Uncharacterized protein n=1 Tax=Anopheles farauti TaxID=69004 RepID=A0A1Y9H9E5_9DIPT
MKNVCILVAILFCSAAVADALILTQAATCERCLSVGALSCGPGAVFSCVGQTAINNCADCNRWMGRCAVYSGFTFCSL